jgi:hypothetical protein
VIKWVTEGLKAKKLLISSICVSYGPSGHHIWLGCGKREHRESMAIFNHIHFKWKYPFRRIICIAPLKEWEHPKMGSGKIGETEKRSEQGFVYITEIEQMGRRIV